MASFRRRRHPPDQRRQRQALSRHKYGLALGGRLWQRLYERVWGTYRQWQALGAQVRKGEHSSLGILWKEFRAKDDDAGDDDDHRRLFAKAFSLFNADQVDGYAPEPGPDLPESERLAAAEAFIAALGIETVYGSASAYYHIAEDRIHMPDFRAFHDAHGFYATHIHEAAHASGAAHRLDRDFSASGPGTRLPWRKRPPN
jgi:antirestriction protein ArdC